MTSSYYLRFDQGTQLDNEMGILANQVHNRYILSFQPTDPEPGLHVLEWNCGKPLKVRLLARISYCAASRTDIP